jgi:ABC-2 type transport system ATP-binding protein
LPSSGTVKVDGVDVVEDPSLVRHKTGYLPDTPPLYDDMSVDEYLVYAGQLRGLRGQDLKKRVDSVVEQTDLGSRRRDLVGSLSHGYRQRVGIAQAIVHSPKLVVLDEPISGLDPVQIVEMRELVRRLAGDHTVILSSHILSEISETCDRLLVIGEGRIIAAGKEAELANRLSGGLNLSVTVRASEAQRDAVESALRAVAAVKGIERAHATELGADIASYEVMAAEDVRGAVASGLVHAGFSILELTRSERELENVFLRLAGGQAGTEEES